MRTGDRKLGPASLRIRQCNALPAHLRSGTRELCDLQTQPDARGQGHAGRLMHKVCAEADAAGLLLILIADRFGDEGLNNDQLCAWYAGRFGFQLLQAEPVRMLARMPGATPRLFTLKPVRQAIELERSH